MREGNSHCEQYFIIIVTAFIQAKMNKAAQEIRGYFM